MQPPNVRHHLAVLMADGRVLVHGVRREQRRGRPERLFRVSDAILGDNLARIADLLLGAMLRESTVRRMEVRMQELGSALWESTGGSDQSGVALGGLNRALEQLRKMNYDAKWEAGPRGPRIILARCPYAAIIEQHPELCQLDTGLIRRASGRMLEQQAKIGREGSTKCVFAAVNDR
jgi:predicted ArsR family transcriptional regulator